MPRPLLIFAALVATVALFAVKLAPASLADARLAAMTKGGVHLIDAEGTLWDARGTLAAGATRIPVAWRIDPWPLILRRELHLHLDRGDGSPATSPKGDIAIGRDSVVLRNVEALVPAGFVSAAAGAGAASIGGEVEVSAALVEWAPPASRGDARLRWRGATVTVPGRAQPVELGDITSALGADGDRVHGPVSNVGGDLGVRGTVALNARNGIELSLVLTPRRADDRELARALSMLGVPDADGWRVEWRLPPR